MAKKPNLEQVKVDLPKEVTKPAETRTFEQIQQEFTNVCARAGHLEYQIFTFKKDLEILNNQMRELNLAAAAVQAQAKQTETTNA